MLGSARARRERHVGDWIPEPLPGHAQWPGGRPAADRADRITLDESVSMAFLVVLESMTPAERVRALEATILECMVNGQPGLVARLDGVVTVFAFDIAGDRIKRIWAVRNPEKLRRLTTA